MNEEYIVEKSTPVEQGDAARWELDTTPWLDKVYHELLGETLDLSSGLWTRDKSKQRFMNELGASAFIQEVNARVSIHMQLSDLDDRRIIEISSRAAEIFAERLVDNYALWEVQPSESSLESIAQQLNDLLEILLLIARKGGMKSHRERVKAPRVVMPPGMEQEVGTEAY